MTGRSIGSPELRANSKWAYRLLAVAIFPANMTLHIPMDLAKWQKAPMPGKDFPVITEMKNAWRLQSTHSAGGYVYWLPEPLRVTDENGGNLKQVFEATWKWKVLRLPKTQPKIPVTKNNDDFAVRVGFLWSDGKNRLSAMDGVQKKLKVRHEVSEVLLYNAVADVDPTHSCGASPYDAKILYCLLPSTPQMQEVQVFPLGDLLKSLEPEAKREIAVRPLSLIGLWVFSDSDDSKSSAESQLMDLTVRLTPQTTPAAQAAHRDEAPARTP
ncbi:MAG: DUF3047 domain-containing protein [Methylotenera sp.]|nr:DUF3047 domain-containing protein [Oligoflexia bacterium]